MGRVTVEMWLVVIVTVVVAEQQQLAAFVWQAGQVLLVLLCDLWRLLYM